MRVALIGYGHWGRRAARAIARVATLETIVEPHPDRMAEAASMWGPWGTRVTSDISDGLAGVDAAWVATPVETHYDVVEQALDFGLHVLCEKPLVEDEHEALRLVMRAQSAGLLLMAGHLSLYTPEANELPDRPAWIRTVRWNQESSISDGSVLWGLGPHDVALVLRAMKGPPDEIVRCVGTKHRVEAEMIWHDPGEMSATEFTERTATIELDWLSTTRYRHLSVGGDHGGDGVVLVDTLASSGEHHARWREPLLAEADEFVRLCGSAPGRTEKADEALSVTRLLKRLEREMTT